MVRVAALERASDRGSTGVVNDETFRIGAQMSHDHAVEYTSESSTQWSTRPTNPTDLNTGPHAPEDASRTCTKILTSVLITTAGERREPNMGGSESCDRGISPTAGCEARLRPSQYGT
jgi:hypothetical protein